VWPRTPLSFQATVLWTVVPLTASTAVLAVAVCHGGGDRRAAWQAGLLAGLVVGVTGLAVWLSRRLARPLRRLQDQAATIAAGGQAMSIAETGPAEFRALAGAFNRMAAAVAAREADLVRSEAAVRQLAADLEKRVVERTADLATANKELEKFAYSVSHDLRAPLRAIDGFSHALLEDYADRLDETGRDYLARVRAGSQRMATLIDDLLMLSKVARAELTPEVIDLSAVARWVVRGLQSADPGRAVAVQIEPAVRARGDPALLQTVLENLLGNAWKYTVHAADARVEFGVTAVGEDRVYFVRDNGAGFDMNYAHKLFKPFQRLHPATEFAGHGIGLATVERVVARHGGRVWAEGTVGGGATFYFTLGPADVGMTKPQ
jgi:signal transduction histidine kinase